MPRFSSKFAMGRALVAGVTAVVLGSTNVAAAQGDSRADPAALNTDVTAGPWTLTVLQVVLGDEAANQVAGASEFNPAAAEGEQFALVQIRATNNGTAAQEIGAGDFGFSGSSGLVRRFADITAPDPALDGVVEPGETKEGWVAGTVGSDETDLILLFDSVTLTGNWADRTFALQDGAKIVDLSERTVPLNTTGREPDAPAGLNDAMSTRDWTIEVLEVAIGQEVYDLFPASDYRTTALADSQGGGDIPYWVAFKVKATNNRSGGAPAFLPPTAFQLANPDGTPVPDFLTLSAPAPDLSGTYYPGASKEGWVAFEQPTDYPGALVRFLPFSTDTDARYFTWDAEANQAASQPTQPAGPIETGTTVVVTDDGVRMRKEPTTNADVIAELAAGTELTVTGPSGQADGLAWYPVDNPATGDSGYIAADYIRPKE
jgi:hypothetical protein